MRVGVKTPRLPHVIVKHMVGKRKRASATLFQFGFTSSAPSEKHAEEQSVNYTYND